MKSLSSLSISDLKLRKNYSIDSIEAIDNILQQGGTLSNTTNLIIGISLLVLGIVIFIGNNNYSSTTGKINYMNCNGKNCVIFVEYTVNNSVFVKEFLLDKNYTCPPDNLVNIIYEISNPDNCYIGSNIYSTLMYLLMSTGIIFIVFWYLVSIGVDSFGLISDNNLYSKTETPNGLYVVSRK